MQGLQSRLCRPKNLDPCGVSLRIAAQMTTKAYCSRASRHLFGLAGRRTSPIGQPRKYSRLPRLPHRAAWAHGSTGPMSTRNNNHSSHRRILISHEPRRIQGSMRRQGVLLGEGQLSAYQALSGLDPGCEPRSPTFSRSLP